MTEKTENQFAQIRVVMMPRDTNAMGNIFGGVILSHIDLAAAEHCRGIAANQYVTKIVREVDFIAPVRVGDIVTFSTETLKVGNSSISVKVDVTAERGLDRAQRIRVTTAELVMVAVDEKGKPKPVS